MKINLELEFSPKEMVVFLEDQGYEVEQGIVTGDLFPSPHPALVAIKETRKTYNVEDRYEVVFKKEISNILAGLLLDNNENIDERLKLLEDRTSSINDLIDNFRDEIEELEFKFDREIKRAKNNK